MANQSPETEKMWVEIFKLRTWYIAPVDLTNVSKDTLGVSFFNNETQQIARQTSSESSSITLAI